MPTAMEVLSILAERLHLQNLNENSAIEELDYGTIISEEQPKLKSESSSCDQSRILSFETGDNAVNNNSILATVLSPCDVISSSVNGSSEAVTLSLSNSSSVRLSTVCASVLRELKNVDNVAAASLTHPGSFMPSVSDPTRLCHTSLLNNLEQYVEDKPVLIESLYKKDLSRKRVLSGSLSNVFSADLAATSSDDEIAELLSNPLPKMHVTPTISLVNDPSAKYGSASEDLAPCKRFCQQSSKLTNESQRVQHQRPSLDFDKMQAFSRSPQTTRPLQDPAVFAFRSISSAAIFPPTTPAVTSLSFSDGCATGDSLIVT